MHARLAVGRGLERVSVSVLGTQLNGNLLESEIIDTYEYDTENRWLKPIHRC
jgi:hypothetical protein